MLVISKNCHYFVEILAIICYNLEMNQIYPRLKLIDEDNLQYSI